MVNQYTTPLPELAALGPAYDKRGRLPACRQTGRAIGRNEWSELRHGQPIRYAIAGTRYARSGLRQTRSPAGVSLNWTQRRP